MPRPAARDLAEPGRPSQPGQDRPGGPDGQAEHVVASVVIAEEKTDKAGASLVGIQAIALIVLVREAAPPVQSEYGEGSQGQAEAQAVAPDQRPIDTLRH